MLDFENWTLGESTDLKKNVCNSFLDWKIFYFIQKAYAHFFFKSKTEGLWGWQMINSGNRKVLQLQSARSMGSGYPFISHSLIGPMVEQEACITR